MAFKNRRVVTGINDDGKSCVISDLTVDQIPACGGAPAVLWATEAFPVSNVGNDDAATPFSVDLFAKSSSFLLFSPPEFGQAPAWHATDTIDYVVVLSGRAKLQLETGDVEVGAGDIIIDRGITHSWAAADDGEPPVLLAAVIRAEPLGSGSHFGENFDTYVKE